MSITIRVCLVQAGGRAYAFAPDDQEGEWPLAQDRDVAGALLGWIDCLRDLLDPEEDCGDVDPVTMALLARLAAEGGTLECLRDDAVALPSYLTRPS